MFAWLGSKVQPQTKLHIDELKKIYMEKILPLEKDFSFDKMHLQNYYFDNKPTVLVIGQPSSGKTSLIKYLLGKDYPEPKTKSKFDKFALLSYGSRDGRLGSNDFSYSNKCESFGNFLDCFEYLEVKSFLLRDITIVDSPGILSDVKQGCSRALMWLAERVELIILVFDSQNIDLRVIDAVFQLKMHWDKIRIVLNKADGLDSVCLMKTYGKLMWSLGKLAKDSDLDKVYIGSFWNKPFRLGTNKQFFQLEERRLFNEIRNLPAVDVTNKLECLTKRTNLIKVRVLVISRLCEKLNIGCRIEEIFENLDMYTEVRKEDDIPEKILPSAETMKDWLKNLNSEQLMDFQPRVMDQINEITKSIDNVRTMIPEVTTKQIDDNVGVKAEESILVYLIVFLVVYVLLFKGF